LSCAICHQPYYQPISLPCGHSFCKECLSWWLDHSAGATADGGQPNESEARGSCPTCRQRLPCPSSSLCVNVSLRACIVTLFGDDIINRIRAGKKATSGERNGMHSRGYECINGLEDEPWRVIGVDAITATGAPARSMHIKMRRSIVLDACDQRMQLAMCLAETPLFNSKTGCTFHLTLITMEEDEVEDSGFPAMVSNEEDEHLICINEDRFQSETCLEVSVNSRLDDDDGNSAVDDGTFMPVARLPFSSTGRSNFIKFHLDFEGSEANRNVRFLHFRHDETNAEIELDLSCISQSTNSSIAENAISNQTAIRKKPNRNKSKNRYILDDESCSDGEEENYDPEEARKDREFFVDDDHVDSGVESEFSNEEKIVADSDPFVASDECDDNDEESHSCHICNDGGELMVCDGGDHEIGGCGRSFHINCVGRHEIPDGDWVCMQCAQGAGMDDVGKEGHEFQNDDGAILPGDLETAVTETKSCPPSPQRSPTKTSQNISTEDAESHGNVEDPAALHSDSSQSSVPLTSIANGIESDEDDFAAIQPRTEQGTKRRQRVKKRRVVLDSDSDDD